LSAAERADRLFRGYAFDLDGTVYLGDGPIPGAPETITALRDAGAHICFLTNKPLERADAYARHLTAIGLPTRPDEIVTSIDALLGYLAANPPARAVLPVTEPLLVTVLRDAGFAVSDRPEDCDVVVVSWDRTFTYDKLERAFRAVRAGARIVATNPDPWCPTPDGGLPDCAAMLAAIEASTGARAEAIVGKPSSWMSRALLDRLGLPPHEVVMVGDRLLTDVRMARDAGMTAALVLTGATTLEQAQAAPEPPDLILRDLTALLPAAARSAP
jgi:HAD superfamily hydrolase (TIGR01450 family)